MNQGSLVKVKIVADILMTAKNESLEVKTFTY